MKETAKTTAKTRKAPKKPAGYQPRFSELDQYLFGQATHYDISEMDAHLDKKDGKVGAWFTYGLRMRRKYLSSANSTAGMPMPM